MNQKLIFEKGQWGLVAQGYSDEDHWDDDPWDTGLPSPVITPDPALAEPDQPPYEPPIELWEDPEIPAIATWSHTYCFLFYEKEALSWYNSWASTGHGNFVFREGLYPSFYDSSPQYPASFSVDLQIKSAITQAETTLKYAKLRYGSLFEFVSEGNRWWQNTMFARYLYQAPSTYRSYDLMYSYPALPAPYYPDPRLSIEHKWTGSRVVPAGTNGFEMSFWMSVNPPDGQYWGKNAPLQYIVIAGTGDDPFPGQPLYVGGQTP